MEMSAKVQQKSVKDNYLKFNSPKSPITKINRTALDIERDDDSFRDLSNSNGSSPACHKSY